jgi:FlaA1/EpsC-like NDP-sugar epimerase
MLNGVSVLITGGTGSWGSFFVKYILEKYDVKQIRIYSRGEHKQVYLKRELNNNPKVKFIIGDVRDLNRLEVASQGVDYIFHLAALKHVPVCEENAYETISTNIDGTKNVVLAAIKNKVKRVIYISTDKAVDPISIYGISKAAAEKLIVNANKETPHTTFVCVRAGNVIGTEGSVFPLFREQLLRVNKIGITDRNMTRLFIALKDAIALVLKAAEKGFGGEIFVLKMKSVGIMDIVDIMKGRFGNDKTQLVDIGIRPGEKIHEMLISRNESSRTKETPEHYVILPTLELGLNQRYAHYPNISFDEYSSSNAPKFGREEFVQLLKEEGWLSLDRHMIDMFKQFTDEEIINVFKKEGWLK